MTPVTTPSDRGSPAVTTTAHKVVTQDGVELALARFTGTIQRRYPVLLTHGTFSNGQICSRLARHLAESGFDAWVLELRGHGRSQAPPAAADFESFGLYDAPAAIGAVRAASGVRLLHLIGHSGGGLAFLMYLARHPEHVAGVASLVTMASQATDACSTLKGQLIVRGAHLLTSLLGYTPGPALRLGPENERKGALASWFRWNYTRTWTGRDGFDYLSALRQVVVPTLVLAGAGDRVIAPVGGCRKLYQALGSREKDFVVAGRSQGFRQDYAHARLIASRAAQDEVWPRVIAWLLKYD
jgi:pimeloyl-ACP methyl ester carboxylesterase